jgi:anthranilate phosphoribosyltransferase
LTGPIKIFYNGGEKIINPSDLGLSVLNYNDIKGGESVEESAKIFMAILEGKGTEPQNDAVIANAAMALFATEQKAGLKHAVARAKEALVSGKALQTFKKLIDSQN